jgi:regulator of protease activity HflC (stomatin/prohibitin superfamily)
MGLNLVKQGNVRLVERMGTYNRTIGPGLHWTNPLIENIRDFTWSFKIGADVEDIRGPNVPQSVMALDPPDMRLNTKDQSVIYVNPNLHIIVTDPVKFVYTYGDAVIEMILKRVEETMRQVCRAHNINALVHNPQIIENRVREVLDEPGGIAEKAGFSVALFTIEEVTPDKERVEYDRKRDLAEREAKAKAVKQEQELDLKRKRQQLELDGEREKRELELDWERKKRKLEYDAEKESIALRLENDRQAANAEAEVKMIRARAKTAEAEECAKRARFAAEAAQAETVAEMEAFSRIYGERAPEMRMRLRELEAIEAFAGKTHVVPSNAVPWLALASGGGGLSTGLPAIAAALEAFRTDPDSADAHVGS